MNRSDRPTTPESCASPLEWHLLTHEADACFSDAWRIYDDAFPRCEKRGREQLLRALTDPLFRPWVVLCAGSVAAIAFCWRMPDALYLEHLAVDPGRRNAKLGSRILEHLAAEGLPLVLEIEPPEEELTRRRLEFYRRNGFVRNGYPYIHPSYRRPFEPHPLVLMSRPEPLTEERAAAFEKFVHGRVLRYSDRDTVPEK